MKWPSSYVIAVTPVPISGLLAWAGGMLPWRDYRAAAGIGNLLERDAVLKRALGFGAETFTRAAGVLRVVGPGT